MEFFVLDLVRGDGRADNLAALAAEGYELVGTVADLAVFRKRQVQLVSRPAAPAPKES